MHSPLFYKNLSDEEIEHHIKKEGFVPLRISNAPGYVYSPHEHPETKLIAVLQGELQVVVQNQKYLCKKYDKIVIPGNITHSAVVGKEGCTFFWAEKK
ncbi:AraC family ligand binding domain-containing protein [Candidatus Roizmanbacteria bacterium]|nr:MAG: AraC family ligand binding domain-containing protein [Candidatus Roizmanbacteria bacterium]